MYKLLPLVWLDRRAVYTSTKYHTYHLFQLNGMFHLDHCTNRSRYYIYIADWEVDQRIILWQVIYEEITWTMGIQ